MYNSPQAISTITLCYNLVGWLFFLELNSPGIVALVRQASRIKLTLETYTHGLVVRMEGFLSTSDFSLHKIPKFHLIFWCGSFVETHSFCRLAAESPKPMQKLCVFTKCSHQKIRRNYIIALLHRCCVRLCGFC